MNAWSVLWGDKYHPAYVYALRDQVAEHLNCPHTFNCITDQELPGISVVRPRTDWPGWWQKLDLWSLVTPWVYFDLDVIITGSLDYLAEYTEHEIAAAANWAQSGHGGIQSSVLVSSGFYHEPFDRFEPPAVWPEDWQRVNGHWGDQEWLTALRGDNFVKLPGVYSYKYHCRSSCIPNDCAVVVFHGKPDPHEIDQIWAQPIPDQLRRAMREGDHTH